MSESPSILLLRLSSLGDIVLTSALISSLREKYPASRIDLMVASDYVELANLLPGLTSVIPFDKRSGIRGLHEARLRLKQVGYSFVLDLHNNLRTRFLRVGVGRILRVIDKRSLKRWLLVKYKYDTLAQEPDVIGRYIETAGDLLVQDDGRTPSLAITGERDPRLVAIAPGARHWNKRWPAEYVQVISQRLVEHGYHLVYLGADSDRSYADIACAGLPAGSYENLCGELSIVETANRIARASVAITNDSGLMHVAQATGTRVIALFGPTVKQFGFAPRAVNAVVLEVEGLYCRPCTAIGLPHCPEKHFRCMREITPERVLEQIELSIAP